MLNLKSKVIRLSDNDLREKAPSIFTETPGSETSKHYTHIPTYKVVQDMKQLGWFPVDAQQVATRKTHTKGVGKHLVVFQNDDIVVNGEDGDVVYPRVNNTPNTPAHTCLLYTSPSPRDRQKSRMPSSA